MYPKVINGKWDGCLIYIDFFINLKRDMNTKKVFSTSDKRKENFKKLNYQFKNL